jgi:hypothetical protein
MKLFKHIDNVLEKHKIKQQEEKIELNEESIRVIMEKEYLGRARQKGGKYTRKMKKR